MYLTVIFFSCHLQIDVKRLDELLIVKAIGTLLDGHFDGLPLGITVIEVKDLVALFDDMICHALLTQILFAVFQIVTERLFGQ